MDRVPRWVGTALIVFGLVVNGVVGLLMLVDGDVGRGLAQLGVAVLIIGIGLGIRRRNGTTART